MNNIAFSPRLQLIILSLIVTGTLICSCTGKPPEIVRVFRQINIIDDREQNLVHSTLTLFIQATDPDGFEDLEEIYLINDTEELFWRMDSETWLKSVSGEETWIGSNSISMPDGADLPGGKYRILLRDLGGEEAERSFNLAGLSASSPRRYIPDISIEEGMIAVSGKADTYTLWVYGSDQNYRRSFSLESGSLSLAEILETDNSLQDGFSFRVFSFFKEKNLGLISGPFYVNP